METNFVVGVTMARMYAKKEVLCILLILVHVGFTCN